MNDAPVAPLVTTRHEEDVAVIEFDDGKANALGHEAIEAILSAFDEVEDAGAVVLAGRPERFSAGFDLKVMAAGPDAARGLLRQGVDLFLRMYLYPARWCPPVRATHWPPAPSSLCAATSGSARGATTGSDYPR